MEISTISSCYAPPFQPRIETIARKHPKRSTTKFGGSRTVRASQDDFDKPQSRTRTDRAGVDSKGNSGPPPIGLAACPSAKDRAGVAPNFYRYRSRDTDGML